METTDKILTIDNDLRKITIPDSIKNLGVESDDDVLRLHFSMPRMYGQVDLSYFAIRINYMNAGNEGDVYVVADKDAEPDAITFSWLVDRTATAYKGNVKFIVCLKLITDDIVVKEFNTTVATLPVLEGLETTEKVVQENPDILEQILLRLDALEQNGPDRNAWHYPDWSHLKWYVMGDSLTAQTYAHTQKYYYEIVQEKTGIQLIVDGIGGTGYRAGYSDNENSFLGRVQRAFPENDKTKNSDIDIVTIFGSGNDIRFISDPNEAKNAIFKTLSHLANNRPGLRVIVVPPSPWMSERDSDYNVITNYDKRGELWKTYCDNLQLCALACDFRYLSDMYDCPPFNPNFSGHLEKFFAPGLDGIHPNENGHKAMAPYFYNALLQELALKV